MGVAIAKRRRWAPGPTARVDWSHPLSAGLVFCAVGEEIDLAKNRQPTLGTPGVTAFGRSRFGGSWANASTTDLAFTSGQWTVAAVCRLINPANISDPFARASYSNESTNAGWSLQYRSIGPHGWTFGSYANNGSGNYLCHSGAYSVAGDYVVMGTATAALRSVYVNGVLTGTQAANLNPASTASGVVKQNGAATDCMTSLQVAWNRALTANEAAAFAADPFCMIR